MMVRDRLPSRSEPRARVALRVLRRHDKLYRVSRIRKTGSGTFSSGPRSKLFLSALSTCVLRRFRVTRARSTISVALGGGPVDVLFEGAQLAGSLTITRGRVSPRKRHRGVPSVIRVDLPSPGAICYLGRPRRGTR